MADRREPQDGGTQQAAERRQPRRRAQPDRLGQDPGRQRRDELGEHRRHLERRRDAPERAVVDERLADGHLGDVVDGHRRIGDELLHDQAADRDERQPGRRQRDERVADRGEQHRADGDRADAPAPGRAGRDHRPDERRGATDPGHDAEHGRAQPEVVEDEQEPGRAEDAPQAGQRHLGADERAQDRVVTDEPEPDPDLGQDRLAILRLRWRRLHRPDRPEQHRRRQVA